MRILHLLASPVWSGPAETVAQLALAQQKLGHQVEVAFDSLRTQPSSEEPAAPRFAALGFENNLGLELSVKSRPAGLFRDLRRLRKLEFDVVHTHFSHDHFLASLALPLRTRLVRSIHAPRSLRPLMPRAHAWTFPYSGIAGSEKRLPQQILPALVDASFQPASNRDKLRASLGIQGSPVLGMVSTFQASRNHALGLAAFEQLLKQQPEAQLVLVGDGVEQAAIEQLAKERGIAQRVLFAGYQSGDRFISWLQALDQVWILGLGNDWSGRAAAQARACGVSVLSVALGGLSQHANRLVSLNAEEIARESLKEVGETGEIGGVGDVGEVKPSESSDLLELSEPVEARAEELQPSTLGAAQASPKRGAETLSMVEELIQALYR